MEIPVEKQCLKGQRLALPGELRGAKAIAVFAVSCVALVLVTAGIAVWKAAR